MLHRSRSRDYGVSPGPTKFTKQQMGDYLTDLRNNRPAKPSGGRPLPSLPSSSRHHAPPSDEPSLPHSSSSSGSSKGMAHSRSSSAMSFYRGTGSMSSGRSSPEKMLYDSVRDRKHHLREKEESHAVRIAMESMHDNNGAHLDDAARDEAFELVRKHQRPHAAFPAPEHEPQRRPAPSDPADFEYGPDGTRYKNGIEVRGDDIRAATSRSLRERSPNLPSPSFVSDRPERPIVSFRKDWKPREEEEDKVSFARAPGPRPLPGPPRPPNRASALPNTMSAPVVPTLRDMDEASHAESKRNSRMPAPPSIAINDAPEPPSVPQISVQGVPEIQVDDDCESSSKTPQITTPSIREPDTPQSATVTPTPKPRQGRPAGSGSARPLPRHAATTPFPLSPSKMTTHAMRGASTLCAQCAVPIYGRTVTAAGTRFHPECFVCCHCGEGLECVQFYPEPAASRNARLERIEMRMAGHDVDPPEGQSLADDSDDSLRFYCHLDYHEFFSPRCKNCKTPIEGEMVVALGAQYHPGHFFCANCGDPFDQQTPFVEKDGYAWCVNCHHNRTSGKCKKCRRPITDMVLKALDAEWHEDCFRCMECSGHFEDGRYFLRGESMDPFCSKCEERRLKA